MTTSLEEKYNDLVKTGKLGADPAQAKAMQELQHLYGEILKKAKKGVFQRMAGIASGKSKNQKGIYIYGGVGRGKSMLMDMFYDALPKNIKKRRVHFHEFMIEVHDYIHTRSMDGSVMGIVEQALPSLAAVTAQRSRILCFDEFHVTDITDAMILGRLFKILFEHGVVVVATSNWAPDDLYKDGLQRDRFIPFIELLKSKVKIVHLDSPTDYRAQTEQIEGTYFMPLNRATDLKMDEIFKKHIGDEKPKKQTIKVKGRNIVSDQAAGGVARFSFSQLCERPHGAEDYLKIAQKYDTVFLEGVPKLGYDRRNEAKRLMNLIDALYEARTRVFISAEVAVDKLYRGHDHSFEFERTVSRLLEMQSAGYP